MLRRTLSIALFGLSIIGCGGESAPTPVSPPPGGSENTIALNPSLTFQTMRGWEVPVINTVLDYAGIVPFMAPLMDQAANDLGINRIVIEMTSGDENPSEACQLDYLRRVISEGVYVNTCAYNSVNDNNDPFVVNENGFHFPLLDWQIENLLLPLKQRVEARGEKLYVLLRYVDFRSSPFEHYQNPEEYAELMQVVFDHINTKYGFTPDGIDVVNEPDNSQASWSAAGMGRAIASGGARLAARGWRPDFVGPSSVNKANAVPYFDTMMATPGTAQFLTDLSWHCYADSGSNTSAAIGSKALQYGVRTSMTECWNTSNTYQMLHQELKTSRNASWQLGTIAGSNGYYEVNNGTGQITLRSKAKYIRQYYKYIRAGARRIEATTTNTSFDPVAFINTDARYVVVVKANSGGSFTVTNLPAGTYGIFYTTGPDGLTVSTYDVNLADQTIAPGRGLTSSIPGTGVITIYAKTRSTVAGASSTGDPTRLQGAEHPDSTESEVARWPKVADITTQDGVRLRLEPLAAFDDEPTDAAWTPDGRLFIAERDGRVDVVRDRRLLTQPALSRDERSDARDQLLALAVDPRFDRTHYVYTISTTRATPGAHPSFRLTRFREASDTLADRIILLDGIPSLPNHPAASLRFGPDGKLFAAFDDAGVADLADDLASVNGKLLRLNPDGTTPDDQVGGNPLLSYSYHSPRGFDWHPAAQTLWLADRDSHGSGRLYVVINGDGSQTRGVHRSPVPLPADSLPSSLTFYRNGAIAALRDNLLIASDEGRHLLRVRFDPDERMQIVSTERLLQDQLGGIRLVTVGPDGVIYLGTATTLVRLVPIR